MADDYDQMFGGDDADADDKKSGGGGLRAQLEKVLAELKTEREARAKLEKDLTARTIGEVFDELKVPDKVRKFYAGEPDKDKILAWVTEHADVFGLTTPDTEPDPPGTEQRNEQLRQVKQASSVGFEGGSGPEAVFRDAEAKIRSGQIREADLDALLRSAFTQK